MTLYLPARSRFQVPAWWPGPVELRRGYDRLFPVSANRSRLIDYSLGFRKAKKGPTRCSGIQWVSNQLLTLDFNFDR